MGTRDEYVDTIKTTFSTLLGRAIKSWLVLNAPFTQWPVIRVIIGMVLDKMIKELSDFADLQAFILFIDIRVGKQGDEMKAAMERNRLAQLNGTPQEKADAEAQLITAHHNLISLKS